MMSPSYSEFSVTAYSTHLDCCSPLVIATTMFHRGVKWTVLRFMPHVNILEYYHRRAPMRKGYSMLSMFSKQMSPLHYAMISINLVAMRNRTCKALRVQPHEERKPLYTCRLYHSKMLTVSKGNRCPVFGNASSTFA